MRRFSRSPGSLVLAALVVEPTHVTTFDPERKK
jgi:hypothetical protein